MDFTAASLIDPELDLTPAQRREIGRAAWKRWMSDRTNMAVYGVGLLVALTLFMFVPDLTARWFGGKSYYHSLGGLVIYVVLLFVLFYTLRRFRFAPCVYAELRSRGFDVCHRCGYRLRGLGDDDQRRPECGAQRRPLSRDDDTPAG